MVAGVCGGLELPPDVSASRGRIPDAVETPPMGWPVGNYIAELARRKRR